MSCEGPSSGLPVGDGSDPTITVVARRKDRPFGPPGPDSGRIGHETRAEGEGPPEGPAAGNDGGLPLGFPQVDALARRAASLFPPSVPKRHVVPMISMFDFGIAAKRPERAPADTFEDRMYRSPLRVDPDASELARRRRAREERQHFDSEFRAAIDNRNRGDSAGALPAAAPERAWR